MRIRFTSLEGLFQLQENVMGGERMEGHPYLGPKARSIGFKPPKNIAQLNRQLSSMLLGSRVTPNPANDVFRLRIVSQSQARHFHQPFVQGGERKTNPIRLRDLSHIAWSAERETTITEEGSGMLSTTTHPPAEDDSPGFPHPCCGWAPPVTRSKARSAGRAMRRLRRSQRDTNSVAATPLTSTGCCFTVAKAEQE